MHGRSGLDAVGMAYAREVFIRNESKLQKLSNNLVTTFHETSKGFVDKVTELFIFLCLPFLKECVWFIIDRPLTFPDLFVWH